MRRSGWRRWHDRFVAGYRTIEIGLPANRHLGRFPSRKGTEQGIDPGLICEFSSENRWMPREDSNLN